MMLRKSRVEPIHAFCGLSLFTFAAMTTPASAEQSAMERIAFGVALAEQTRDVCYYAPEVPATLDQLAARIAEAKPALWQRVLDVSRTNAKGMGNFARLTNPSLNDCQAVGLGISDALVYHVTMLGPNPVVLQEMERLGKLGGRLATEGASSKVDDRAASPDDAAVGQQANISWDAGSAVTGKWQFVSGEEDWGTMCFSSIKYGAVQVGFFASPGNDQITAYVDGIYQGNVRTQWQVDDAAPHALNGSSDDYFGWHNFNDVPAQLLAEAASGRRLTIMSDSGRLSVSLDGSGGSLFSLARCVGASASSTQQQTPEEVVGALSSPFDATALQALCNSGRDDPAYFKAVAEFASGRRVQAQIKAKSYKNSSTLEGNPAVEGGAVIDDIVVTVFLNNPSSQHHAEADEIVRVNGAIYRQLERTDAGQCVVRIGTGEIASIPG